MPVYACACPIGDPLRSPASLYFGLEYAGHGGPIIEEVQAIPRYIS